MKFILCIYIIFHLLSAQISLPTFQAIQKTSSTSSNTLIFTNCGSTGKSGPNQSDCNSEYSGTSLNGLVTVTSGIQKWTVPSTAIYTIETYGAEGGGSNGGKGAKMVGDFNLSEGDIIHILVGQQGSTSNPMSTGGGGTYVVEQSGSTHTLTTHSVFVTPLIISGGGGGSSDSATDTQNGTTSNSGQTGYGGWGSPKSGGTNGNGGNGTGGSGGGGGGGGFLSNGSVYSGGKSFLNGGTGGVRTQGSAGIDGSFGGGGGARNNGGSFFGGGAGGGYSGGGGACGTSSDEDNGGGGGSYNSGSNTSGVTGSNSGHGKVIISW